MIDIHSHIISGIDDGAATMEESVKMAALAEKDGISTIVATPHYIEGEFNSDTKTNKQLLENLKLEVKKAGIKVELLLGNEVYAAPELITMINSDKISTLNSSRYLLMELPMQGFSQYLERLVFDLRLHGIVAVLAHPERNSGIMANLQLLKKLIKMGALVQLNRLSITGGYGKKIFDAAVLLLEHEMVHILGSDAHSANKRRPELSDAAEALSYYCSEALLSRLLYENPEKIIWNEPVDIWEPKAIRIK